MIYYNKEVKYMIYTLTLSPSIDYYLILNELKLGKINRSQTEYIRIGGKGINVSKVLKELDVKSIPVLLTAGFTKDKILEDLDNQEFNYHNIDVNGINRINVKIQAEEETAINTNGLFISDFHIDKIIDYLKRSKSIGVKVSAIEFSDDKGVYDTIYVKNIDDFYNAHHKL